MSDNNDKNFDNMRYDEQEIAAEKRQKTEKIAAEIIQMSKNKLLVNMRFMDMSLNQFQIFQNLDTHPLLRATGKYISTPRNIF